MRQGMVSRRGSGWSFTVDVSPPGAPRRQRSKGGFRTKAEALQAMHDVQSSVVAGRYVPASRLCLGPYLTETWLPAVKSSVRAGTWDSYESYIRLYVVPQLGDVPLQSLTRADLRKFYSALEAGGRRRGSGGLSPKTVHNIHVTLLKALGDAVEDQLIPRNPATRGHRACAEPSRMTTWSADQVRAFLRHVQDDRLFALWRLAVSTGMRRAELLGPYHGARRPGQPRRPSRTARRGGTAERTSAASKSIVRAAKQPVRRLAAAFLARSAVP